MTVAFSVVVPTLRRPDDLRRTLAAVRACDPGPVEVIVVDGDEAASAKPVAEELGARWLGGERGLTRQRNVGVATCRGDVIVFFDDDARPAPDVFGVLAKAYEDPSVVGATGRVVEPGGGRLVGKQSPVRRLLFRGEEGRFTRFGYPRHLTRLDQPRDVELMQGCFMSGRREAVAAVGFDERLPGYGLAEDEDFSYRLSRLGRIRFLPEAVVHHDNTGFGTRDHRAFGRQVMVNRSYLFRKNFPQTPSARVQFALLFLVLVAHRVVNWEWRGVQGLVEGAWEAWRPGAPR